MSDTPLSAQSPSSTPIGAGRGDGRGGSRDTSEPADLPPGDEQDEPPIPSPRGEQDEPRSEQQERPSPSALSEPALSPLSDQEEAVMRALGRLLMVLPRVMDSDLQRDQRMSLSEYSALRHLSEKPGRRMRMSELAAACDMSLSGMTRLAGKLESVGFIERVRCERDARGLEATLTEAGLCRLRAAWPDHLASVRRHIFDHLSGLDMCKLAAALNEMARP